MPGLRQTPGQILRGAESYSFNDLHGDLMCDLFIK